MKTTSSSVTDGRLISARWQWSALFCCCLALTANAAHELLLAVDTKNNLFSFYSDAPGTLLHSHSITGLQASEHIFGVTVGPNGALYGLGSSRRLYTMDPNTGNATQVGSSFSTLLDGINFGCSVGATGMRVVSGEGTTNHQNLLINITTGVATVGPPLIYGGPFAVAGLAYDWGSNVWYVANAVGDTFYTLDPATGLLTLIGPSGFTFPLYSGFTISAASGIAYLAATVNGQAQLYTINKGSHTYRPNRKLRLRR